MLLIEKKRKAQTISMDFYTSLIIFIMILGLSISLWDDSIKDVSWSIQVQEMNNYANKIADSLSTGGDRNWLKPGIGQHIVKFLSEGEEYTYEWEGDTIEKVRFEVEVNNEKFDWGVTKGKTANSLFGQIALVAKDNEVTVGFITGGIDWTFSI